MAVGDASCRVWDTDDPEAMPSHASQEGSKLGRQHQASKDLQRKEKEKQQKLLQKFSKQQQVHMVQQQQLESVSAQTAALTLRAPVPIATEQKLDVTGNDIFLKPTSGLFGDLLLNSFLILKKKPTRTPDHSHLVVVNNVGNSNSTSSSGGSRGDEAKCCNFHWDLGDQLVGFDYYGDSAYM